MSDKKSKFPNILMLGNGLLRAYGETFSWGKLLEEFHCNDRIPKSVDLSHVSFPLEIVLRTDDNIDRILKEKSQKLFMNSVTDELYNIISELLECRFDHVLTTNYGYEIEIVANKCINISEAKLKKIQRHTSRVSKAESKNMLHTYYEINNNRIWHIHGEARKYSSIVLGHYCYGNLLSKCREYLSNVGNRYQIVQDKKGVQSIESWIDAFILGDVYILGLGMSFSELDLWWLINRKKRERANVGSVYFFEPKSLEATYKHELLRCYDVDVIDLGITLLEHENNETEEERMRINFENAKLYDEFYSKAIQTIRDLLV